ncbi:VpsP family polysaccharide biosynthesis protein [Thalassotalea atypica]|uniref:VpsP family polysaccharide biosynthesis protein n=1 Tax=Thalassotalea atypica TaxID=2054316 RepID=UPI00257452E5|nr:VpsP family polysaccharide biosynthesis protein [Thalassotalea atypica]
MKFKLASFTNVQPIILVVLTLLCLFGIVQAAKMGKANLDFYRVHQTLEYWRDNQQITNDEELNQTLTIIHRANNTHPNNPQYLITLGLVYEWGGLHAAEQADKMHYFNEARKYYSRATELRPTWPGTWATLATLKWRLNEIDQQLVEYLFLADKFGENSDQVHEAWLEVGFYLYKSKSVFSAKIIKGLRKHLQLMVEDPRNKINALALTIVKRHNVEQLACNWVTNFNIEDEVKKEKFCQTTSSRS